MPKTAFGTNDPRTRKLWSKKAFKYALENMWLTTHGFMGTTPDKIIQIDKDLVKSVGDKITFELLVPPTGTGQGDDGQMIGNSEALEIQNFPLEVHERVHSFQSSGPMSEKRTSTQMRSTFKTQLGLWKAEILENDIMLALSGLYNCSSDISTINEKAPSSDRIYYGGQTVAGAVSAAAMTTDALLSAETVASTLFGTRIIDIIRRKGQLCQPKIRPVIIEGEKIHGVMLIHPLQAKALEAETVTAGFSAAQLQAAIRGKKNPIFSGAMGMWRGVLIHVYDRIQMRTGAGGTTPAEGFTLNAGRTATSDAVATGRNVARALYMGAQAAVVGWGKMPTWREFDTDGGRKPGVGTDMIYGVSKTRFRRYSSGADSNTNQEDYGVICVDTHVVPD